MNTPVRNHVEKQPESPPGKSVFWLAWLPALLWMVLIFSASGDGMSAPRTSRFLGPMLAWLFPSWSPEALAQGQFFIRKMAHVTEYAILAGWLWLGMRHTDRRGPGWNWTRARQVALMAMCYAATDEFHQSWVPSRQGSPWDVLLDTSGALLGLVGLALLIHRMGRGSRRKDETAPAANSHRLDPWDSRGGPD